MTSMQNTARRLAADEVNRRIQTGPHAFVEEECARYRAEVARAEDWLNDVNVRRRVVLLSGPSSSGKTSTAGLLCDGLRRDGADAYVVSLDNFYLGRGRAPRLPDGGFDYESPEALDLPLLAECIRGLLEDGRAFLPEYDFASGEPRPERTELTLASRSVVVFEGIHALHPHLRDQLPKKHVKRLLIRAHSGFFDSEQEILSGRQIRLARRLVRDVKFRNTSASDTLDMWPQVIRGEEQYLFPYADCADMVIDTTHAFEPCMVAPRLLPLLATVSPQHSQYETAQRLRAAMERFVPASCALLPSDSILNEFLG